MHCQSEIGKDVVLGRNCKEVNEGVEVHHGVRCIDSLKLGKIWCWGEIERK
jgi:hypothetical protein